MEVPPCSLAKSAALAPPYILDATHSKADSEVRLDRPADIRNNATLSDPSVANSDRTLNNQESREAALDDLAERLTNTAISAALSEISLDNLAERLATESIQRALCELELDRATSLLVSAALAAATEEMLQEEGSTIVDVMADDSTDSIPDPAERFVRRKVSVLLQVPQTTLGRPASSYSLLDAYFDATSEGEEEDDDDLTIVASGNSVRDTLVEPFSPREISAMGIAELQHLLSEVRAVNARIGQHSGLTEEPADRRQSTTSSSTFSDSREAAMGRQEERRRGSGGTFGPQDTAETCEQSEPTDPLDKRDSLKRFSTRTSLRTIIEQIPMPPADRPLTPASAEPPEPPRPGMFRRPSLFPSLEQLRSEQMAWKLARKGSAFSMNSPSDSRSNAPAESARSPPPNVPLPYLPPTSPPPPHAPPPIPTDDIPLSATNGRSNVKALKMLGIIGRPGEDIVLPSPSTPPSHAPPPIPTTPRAITAASDSEEDDTAVGRSDVKALKTLGLFTSPPDDSADISGRFGAASPPPPHPPPPIPSADVPSLSNNNHPTIGRPNAKALMTLGLISSTSDSVLFTIASPPPKDKLPPIPIAAEAADRKASDIISDEDEDEDDKRMSTRTNSKALKLLGIVPAAAVNRPTSDLSVPPLPPVSSPKVVSPTPTSSDEEEERLARRRSTATHRSNAKALKMLGIISRTDANRGFAANEKAMKLLGLQDDAGASAVTTNEERKRFSTLNRNSSVRSFNGLGEVNGTFKPDRGSLQSYQELVHSPAELRRIPSSGSHSSTAASTSSSRPGSTTSEPTVSFRQSAMPTLSSRASMNTLKRKSMQLVTAAMPTFSSMPPSPATKLSPNQILHSGGVQITKNPPGSLFRTWKRRHCVLTRGFLYIYAASAAPELSNIGNTHNPGRPLDVIYVGVGTEFKCMSAENVGRRCILGFTVRSGGARTLYLAADDIVWKTVLDRLNAELKAPPRIPTLPRSTISLTLPMPPITPSFTEKSPTLPLPPIVSSFVEKSPMSPKFPMSPEAIMSPRTPMSPKALQTIRSSTPTPSSGTGAPATPPPSPPPPQPIRKRISDAPPATPPPTSPLPPVPFPAALHRLSQQSRGELFRRPSVASSIASSTSGSVVGTGAGPHHRLRHDTLGSAISLLDELLAKERRSSVLREDGVSM
ncbi:hypothetical protein HDU87_001046 [Geranomyces variabilis]|uniref:PH domain-containing protein n=1 Tax=Geranomyces variabilis TaxID=109894 RepID=A0AAD5TQ49_9FUNG|nr:hypothetical protein HDU87_001046 [Geranomyces variabilis]